MPSRSVISKFRVHDGVTLDTLNQMREWEVLGAQCSACGRVAWLDRRKVVARVGDQYLGNLRGKLRCYCGNQRDNDVLVGIMDRNV